MNAIDSGPAAGLSVRIGSARPVTTDSGGNFQAELAKQGQHETTVTGSGMVERVTSITGPTTERARLSIIPASFDLQAFDEMFRATNARLQRWTTQPSLVVLGSVMSLRSGSDGEYRAESEQMSADEVAAMIAHLTEGLSLLTGGTYTTFAAVEIERPLAGQHAAVTRPGKIVVGRYTGVVSTAGTIGFGQWAEDANGSVVAGAMFLDNAYDRDNVLRRLLRIHELGHALGYQHVTTRVSIMNPSIGPDPTEFDRAGAVIAFQRPPGNRTPDIDPSSGPPVSSGGGSFTRWSAPISCVRSDGTGSCGGPSQARRIPRAARPRRPGTTRVCR